MGSFSSSEKLGEQVKAAQLQLNHDRKTQQQRYKDLQSLPPKEAAQVLNNVHESVRDSFSQRAAFLDATLLLAWLDDEAQCKQAVMDTVEEVMSAPIKRHEFEWFRDFLLPSSIWFMQSEANQKYMFEELLEKVQAKSKSKMESMDRIYKHLASHEDWPRIMAIANQTAVERQDDPRVGLLRGDGLRKVFDAKEDDVKDDEERTRQAELKTFMDSTLCINVLTATATKIDDEFQRYMKGVLGQHGDVRAGPTKKVQRCQAKLEGDYQDAQYPKSAKLLDLARCSVTFNTLEQMVEGFHSLLEHVSDKTNHKYIEFARVKNGFLDPLHHGYRDIKMNVVFKSQRHPGTHMVCEVQFLLVNYLMEKKKMHRLYSVERMRAFFEAVVAADQNDSGQDQPRDVTQLKLTQVMDVAKEVEFERVQKAQFVHKCSVHSKWQLVAMEDQTSGSFVIVDMKRKQTVFEAKREKEGLNNCHSHKWLSMNGHEYVSVQWSKREIKMFKVTKQDGYDGGPADAAQQIVKKKSFVMFKTKRNSKPFLVEEDKAYGLKHPADDILLTDLSSSRHAKHLLLLTTHQVLEMRSLADLRTVTRRIKLEDRIRRSGARAMRVSSDGSLCVVAGGTTKPYFYVVDLMKEQQLKFTSSYLQDTLAPCFMNGENEFVAVGGNHGFIEIWSISEQAPVKQIKVGQDGYDAGYITSSASTHNVYAVATRNDNTLRLYDMSSWECFYEQQFAAEGASLDLTRDLKYVTYAGMNEPLFGCFVLRIE